MNGPFSERSISMIQCIIFDLADTLIRGLTGIEELLAEKYLSTPKEQILACFRGEEMGEFLIGNRSETEYWPN
jgi:hypothetical protein